MASGAPPSGPCASRDGERSRAAVRVLPATLKTISFVTPSSLRFPLCATSSFCEDTTPTIDMRARWSFDFFSFHFCRSKRAHSASGAARRFDILHCGAPGGAGPHCVQLLFSHQRRDRAHGEYGSSFRHTGHGQCRIRRQHGREADQFPQERADGRPLNKLLYSGLGKFIERAKEMKDLRRSAKEREQPEMFLATISARPHALLLSPA